MLAQHKSSWRQGLARTRSALALAVVTSLASLATIRDAPAQWLGHAPWCAETGHVARECDYYSLAQCMARASGISNACSVNPWYVPRPQRPSRPHRVSRK
jgi:hypothetical protein